jgi:hypothetical protein
MDRKWNAIANTTASFDATANVTTNYIVTITQTTSGCVATGSASVTVNTPYCCYGSDCIDKCL